ncbi:hypothetical protein, conserved [Trypanosoma cruzi]|uniref:Uncharacterized protein n=1 Tax=Trypanosoma cruzi (strain CL Brener) TaxID=353153 RepID=Q4D2G9_TRYCC|nr:hypothetical protein, conserved [Trypanosoma cruzi]EAN86720.1 hypothetical protein, conserved [Trypanosoma cruzi]|eukprot:XP_808571.1 hypothetical protein [Trypanosoma cruzi strain CL Brener]
MNTGWISSISFSFFSAQGMKRLPVREIGLLCERLQSVQGSDAKLQGAIAEGIRTRVVDKNTLPFIVQRLALSGNWQLAVKVMESECLDRRQIRRDQNAWPILERVAPCGESRDAIRRALVRLYGVACRPKTK